MEGVIAALWALIRIRGLPEVYQKDDRDSAHCRCSAEGVRAALHCTNCRDSQHGKHLTSLSTLRAFPSLPLIVLLKTASCIYSPRHCHSAAWLPNTLALYSKDT